MRRLALLVPLVVATAGWCGAPEKATGLAPVSAADLPHPEPLRPADFRDVILAALGRHLDLTLAALDQGIASQRLQQAGHDFLPSFDAGAGFSHLHGRKQGSFGNLRQVDFDRYDPQFGLSLALNLGERIHRLRARQHQYASSRYRYLDARRRVLLGVSELYQNLRVAQVGTAIAHRLVEDRRHMVEVIRARVTAGTALASELAQARAALAAARSQWVAAANQWAQASIRLARVLRWDPQQLLLAREVPVAPVPMREDGVRPDREALDEAVKAAGEAASASWWRLWGPKLQVQLRYTQLGTDPGDLDDQEFYRVFLGWRLSLAAWDEIRLQQRKLARTRVQLQQLDDAVRAEVAAVSRQLQAARARVPLARERLAAAREHLELATARYRAGKTILLEVLNAEAALAQARFDLVEAVSLLHLARIRQLADSGALSPQQLLGEDGEEK